MWDNVQHQSDTGWRDAFLRFEVCLGVEISLEFGTWVLEFPSSGRFTPVDARPCKLFLGVRP